jgi:mono/diheme cytochrome c family protein
MNILARISVAVLVLGAAQCTGVLKAQETGKAKEERGAAGSAVERGRYIVESVAMCGRCHTAYNQAGESEKRNKLLGGPNTIQPTYPIPNWAVVEPRLAGRPPGTDEDFIRLLTTGISRTGAPPNPPMPPFRLTRSDAEAVLAYLKSLQR